MKKIFIVFIFLAYLTQSMQGSQALVTPEQVGQIKQSILHELLEQLKKDTPILVYPGDPAVLEDLYSGLSLFVSQYSCKGYTSNFALRQSNQAFFIQQHIQGLTKRILEDEADLKTKILKKMFNQSNFTGLCVKEQTKDSAFEWCSTTPEHTQGKYQIKVLLTRDEAKPIREALHKKLSTKKRKENFDAILPSKL